MVELSTFPSIQLPASENRYRLNGGAREERRHYSGASRSKT